MPPDSDALVRMVAQLRADNERLLTHETELEAALETLRRSDERLRLATMAAGIGVWEWDIATNRVDWDARKHDMFGTDAASFAGTREAFFDLIHPDDRAEVAATLTRALETGVAYVNEFRIRASDGGLRWIANQGELVRDDRGRPMRMLGVVRDITKERRAQSALQDSEARFRAFVNATDDWIWSVDTEGRLLDSNPAMTRMLGWDRGALVGRPLSDFVHEEDLPRVHAVLADAVLRRRGWTGMEVRCQHTDGTYRELECHGVPLFRDGALIGFQGADREVTGRRAAARAAQQATRLDAVATLTGSVAHHFNNLLCVIIANAELATLLCERTPAAALVHEISEAGTRAAALIRQLMTFTGARTTAPRMIDVNDRLLTLTAALRTELPPSIDLRLDANRGIWPTRIDPDDFDIAVTAVVTNACEALSDGGPLQVTATNLEADSPEGPRGTEVVEGDYVCIAVHDGGRGMTEDVVRRAFEPFFSTKPLGAQPVGLGLAVCYGIVAQCGGHVRIETAAGQGTTVRLLLPRASDHSSAGTGEVLRSTLDGQESDQPAS